MTSNFPTIRVLHVDDEPDFADLAAEFIERQGDGFTVETTLSASEGIELLSQGGFDCVVSDYDMPGQNGIEFPEAVREEFPDLPFILYTGKGSEEVASDAISAGVTDYLQKETGASQYEVLANRIRNVVDQRRAEMEAVETEQRLRTIAENSNDILWKFTADWNELLFINSPYEEIWGRSISELREEPQSFLKGIHPDDRQLIKDAMAQLSAGDSVDIEYRVNAEEDFGRWVWVQGEPVFDDEGEVEKVVGFARDITHRMEQSRRFEALIEYSMDVITVIDDAGTITYESPSVERILGYRPDELIDENAFDYVHPDDRTPVYELFKELISNPDSDIKSATFRFKHADGSWVWLESIGRLEPHPAIDGYVLNSRDVTERIERERTLEESYERFRSIAESATDAILTIDPNSTIRFANQAVERVFGYSPAELEGESLTMLLPERYRDQHRAALQRYLDTGERSLDWTSVEFPGLHKDGHEIDLQISFSEIGLDGENRFTGIIRT